MALVPWDPFRELMDLRQSFDRVLKGLGPKVKGLTTGFRYPAIDVYEKKNKVVVKAEMPGVEKKDISISATPDSLTIKGESKKEKEIKKKDYYHSERSYGAYSRTIPLPAPVNEKKIKASLKSGVLEIILPKRKERRRKAREIEIE